MLGSAGQPLFAEDSWLHLALGASYASEGPWLDADPLLHTAAGPPAPSAWLFGAALHGLERTTGFAGLRAAHVLCVAAILLLAGRLALRTGGNTAFAWLALGLFAALSSYRLFQLRPHLVTILGALCVLWFVLRERAPPSWRGIVALALGFALWVNAHGGFVLGLVLLFAAAAALAGSALVFPAQRAEQLPRAGRLAAAFGLALVASLANPSGAEQHLLYFAAGAETPELAVVADEWAPVRLLSLPQAQVPPTVLDWTVLWLLLPASLLAALHQLRAGRADPALLALAAVSWIALLSAVRLTWLALVPLLLVGSALEPRRFVSWSAAAAGVLLVPAFLFAGAWPSISAGVLRDTYAQPYPVAKHPSHAVWLLRDAGVEGNLWNDYATGNFLGYWLAPRLRVFVNGSLNVPLDVMQSLDVIRARADEDGERFSERLDRHGVDVFLGTGLPVVPRGGRHRVATTGHLEGEPGWLPIFRSPRSALYLRRNARNAENLARVAAYYAKHGVPFDAEAGFDPGRVTGEAPIWSIEHGLLPVDYRAVEEASLSLDPRRRRPAQERLARNAALLGLYERALAIDRSRLRRAPDALTALRRQLWCRLHQGEPASTLAAADALEAVAPSTDGLSRLLVDSARQIVALPAPERAARVAALPLLTRPEMQQVLARLLQAEARTGSEKPLPPGDFAVR